MKYFQALFLVVAIFTSCETSRAVSNNNGNSTVPAPSAVVVTPDPQTRAETAMTQPAITNDVTAGNAISVSGNTMSNSTLNNSTLNTLITAPPALQAIFIARFPTASNINWYNYNGSNIPIDWELNGWPALTSQDYRVNYFINDVPYFAWFDQSNFIGTTTSVTDFTKLPLPVSSVITSKYPGYTILEAHQQIYRDVPGYQVEIYKGLDKIRLVLDANGNITRQKSSSTSAFPK